MKRRDFLIQGTAAVTAPMATRTGVFPRTMIAGQAESPSALASAHLIWSPSVTPVEIRSGGVAQGIASSSDGSSRAATPDLHCVFAKEITLSALPGFAMLHLFAFTRYRLYVNGHYIGRGPCRYQNQRPEYDSRDIRGWLRSGQNTVVVLVHRDAPTGRIMQHAPGFVAALELSVDGKRRVINTDTSWLSMQERSFGPRRQAWSSIEEHIDARDTHDWTRPDLTLPLWQPPVVVPNSESIRFFPRGTPLQMERERSWSSSAAAVPAEISAGSQMEFSLSEIAQAFHVLEMEAAEGSSLEISYCLPQGVESGKCTYIARTGTQTYMGGDTFAFRWLRLRVIAGHIRLTRAAAYEVRYPFERIAWFSCNDPFLNQLWNICARSLEVLSEDSYVDCADRERVEWTDDSPPAFDCTRVMMRGPGDSPSGLRKSQWGDARLLGGLLRRIGLTQQADGQLKAHSCSERFDIHAIMEDRSCDWIVLLREYFESCGDSDLVRELWPTLTRLLKWYRKRRTARGLLLAREWEVWDNPLRYQICEGAGLNAMLYRALTDASLLAQSVGKTEDAKSFAEEAKRLQDDFNRLLWNDREDAYDGALFGPGSKMSGRFSGPVVDGRFQPTVQANLFALYSGVVPADRLVLVRKWVLGHLEEVREPMSHYYLFRMMYEMEEPQQDAGVLRLMRAGWKNQVASEWQTTWEGLEKGGGSKLHIYGMHPGYFLTAYVLGARRDGAVARRTILIEPRLSDLHWAKGSCVTEFGPVEMEWKIEDTGGVRIVCNVPDRVHARVRVCSAEARDSLELNGKLVTANRVGDCLEMVVGSGKHTIRTLR
jgi:alpha-L-rhamnosidase